MTREQILALSDEEAKKVFANEHCNISADLAGILARAIIQQYKDSLLKDVGEPVAEIRSRDIGYASEENYAVILNPVAEGAKLFTKSQLLAAVAKKDEEINRLKVELETERMRLAGCGVTALGYFEGCSDEYKSASLDDVLRLRQQLKAAQEEIERLKATPPDKREDLRCVISDLCHQVRERDAALARLSEERDIWDRMLGDAADKFAHLEREIDDCLYVLDALWDKQCDKIVTQKWAEILTRNKRVTGASSAEDSSEPTSSE